MTRKPFLNKKGNRNMNLNERIEELAA